MSDEVDERIDLQALDASNHPARTEALIGEIVTRVRALPQLDADIAAVLRARRALLAAAAVFILVALGTVIVGENQAAEPSVSMIAGWATDRHVPTNAELLAAFQGYQP